MNKRAVIHPDRTTDFDTGAYSDGLVVGNLLFVSGQAAVDFKTSEFRLGTIEEETQRTLDNIRAIVKQAGATMDDVVKCTVHLADMREFGRFNAVYGTCFSDVKPTRTTVQSVLDHGIKVEIDAIVHLPPA